MDLQSQANFLAIQKLREDLERGRERERELREQLSGNTKKADPASQEKLAEWFRSFQATQALLKNTGRTFMEAADILADLDDLIPLSEDTKGKPSSLYLLVPLLFRFILSSQLFWL